MIILRPDTIFSKISFKGTVRLRTIAPTRCCLSLAPVANERRLVQDDNTIE